MFLQHTSLKQNYIYIAIFTEHLKLCSSHRAGFPEQLSEAYQHLGSTLSLLLNVQVVHCTDENIKSLTESITQHA